MNGLEYEATSHVIRSHVYSSHYPFKSAYPICWHNELRTFFQYAYISLSCHLLLDLQTIIFKMDHHKDCSADATNSLLMSFADAYGMLFMHNYSYHTNANIRHVFPPLQVNIHMCTTCRLSVNRVQCWRGISSCYPPSHPPADIHTGGVHAQYCCEHCSAVHSDIYSGYCSTDTLLN